MDSKEYYRQNKERILSRQREYYRKNAKAIKARNRKYRTKNWAQRARLMWHAAKARAKTKNLAFDLSVEFLEELLNDQDHCCAVTTLPLTLLPNSPWSPSVDQIKPAGGYTADNIQIVCTMYNYAKGKWHHDDILLFVQALAAPTNHEV